MRIVIATMLLALAGCGSADVVREPDTEQKDNAASAETARTAPAEAAPNMRALGVTDIGDARIGVVRDAETGCDYIMADGYQTNPAVVRTNAAGPVCDGARISGFAVESRSDLGGFEAIRVLDKGTGCRWIFVDGYKAGDIVPAMRGGKQDCGVAEQATG